MCCDKSNDIQLLDMERKSTTTRIGEFQSDLIKKLFGGDSITITWKDLWRVIKGYKILATETTIWNLFLDEERLTLTQCEETDPKGKRESVRKSEKFEKNDITTERASFLFNMRESSKKSENWVTGWKYKYFYKMLKKKLFQPSGFNFMISTIIVFNVVVFFYGAVFPMGEDILDTSELCIAVFAFYALCILGYFLSLMGEQWYPKTYGGLVVDIIFMAVSVTFCVLLSYVLTPSYYEGHGCFKCPWCPDTDDKLCFEYSKFHGDISSHYAEANTCFCALDERLRINEPIIPYGKTEDYCGGDDCSCETILSSSPENWSISQEYFSCVYYSPTGKPHFFLIGALIILGTGIAAVTSFYRTCITGVSSCMYFICRKFCCIKDSGRINSLSDVENEPEGYAL